MLARFAAVRIRRAFAVAALIAAAGFALAASTAGAASWAPTGDLTTGRSGAAAVLLLDGRPLIVAGSNPVGGSHSLNSAEIFSPAAGMWSSGGALTTARQLHTATTLDSGKVLTAGGFDVELPPGTSQALKSAELYDPTANTWSPATDMGLGQERSGHTATLLGDGRVFVAGGLGPYSINALMSTRIYKPASNSWSAGPTLTTGRFEHTATLLKTGKVLIVGGSAVSTSPTVLKSAERYDPRALPASQISPAGSTTDARESHTATLLQDGRVLVVGGYDGTKVLKTAELYDPYANSWKPAASLHGPREGQTATLLRDGRVLVAGGDAGDTSIKTTEIYNPATNSWSLGPSMTAAREGHIATGLPSGRVLAAAGVDAAGNTLKSAELFSAVPPSRDARRPVVAYVDNGHFGLFDSETQKDLVPPPIPAGVARFAISLNGRYVAYLHPTTKHIHLYDRYVHKEVSLPGIDDSDHGNPTMSVSDTGLIAFDHATSDLTRVYDSKSKHFVATGLPADNAHRQPAISADGHFLATTCLDHCVAPTVDGDDAYVQDLFTKQNVPFPDNLAGSGIGGEEHPCINGNGALVGVDITKGMQVDIYLYSTTGANLLPVPNDPGILNVHCALDRSGQHIVLENGNNSTDRLYDRLTGALVPLPAKIHDVVALSDPVLQPPNTRITKASVKKKKGTAKFSFVAIGRASGFQCELIRPKRKHHKPPPKPRFTSCRSPKTYKHLGQGKFTFKVRAFNAAGVDATPAHKTFTIKKKKKKK